NKDLVGITTKSLSCRRQIKTPHLVMMEIHFFRWKIYPSGSDCDLCNRTEHSILRQAKKATQLNRKLDLAAAATKDGVCFYPQQFRAVNHERHVRPPFEDFTAACAFSTAPASPHRAAWGFPTQGACN